MGSYSYPLWLNISCNWNGRGVVKHCDRFLLYDFFYLFLTWIRWNSEIAASCKIHCVELHKLSLISTNFPWILFLYPEFFESFGIKIYDKFAIIHVAKHSVYFRRIHVIFRIYIQISILFDRFLLTLHGQVKLVSE